MRLPPPRWLDYEEIRNESDKFLAAHWPEGVSPIDIEKIVDARLGIDIIEAKGLKQQVGVDGFLSRDGGTLYVDAGTRQHLPGRLRFTLAHEMGHRVLHQDLYGAADFRTPGEWLRMQAALSAKEHASYEHQAYCFGGLVLVPRGHLRNTVDAAIALAENHGYHADLGNEADVAYVAAWAGRRMRVSAEVVLRRGRYDGLWA